MTINCKGNLIDCSVPRVMGILNSTPDSFFAKSRLTDANAILVRVEKMLAQGATFIDIGGYSSRPGAAFVPVEAEMERVIPVVDLILDHFPSALLSIDTFRSEVARAGVGHGAAMINDISAGMFDAAMLETVAQLQVPYVMMHLDGTFETMHQAADSNDVIKDVLFYFSQRIAAARATGINDIIIDPGFGFSKTLGQNYEILQKLELFELLELPVLVGFSRKSMIQKVLGVGANDALNGTSVLNTLALAKGAKILRVHDVAEAVEAIRLFRAASQLTFD